MFVKDAQNTLTLNGKDAILVIYVEDATPEDVLSKLGKFSTYLYTPPTRLLKPKSLLRY